MDKRLRIAGIAAALAFSAIILLSPSDPLPLPEPTTTDRGSESVQVIATDLREPRSIAVAGDDILLAQKDGTILAVKNGTVLERPLATLRVVDVFDGGLLGIAAHPNYTENGLLYAYYTYAENDALWNKILRITVSDNRLQDASTILDGIPGSKFSNGGAIKFGPDGMLYVGTGAVSDSLHLSQNMDSLAGKILRIDGSGAVPDDNPFPGSPIFTLGHRDPRGLAWDGNGTMYSSELGSAKNDEINIIEAGRNYGWPDHECSGAPGYEDPLVCFDPAIEPGGIIIYLGDRLDTRDMMIMASLRASGLYVLGPDGEERGQSILGGLGRIRDVAEDPGGALYVITSNTDGKGFPGPSDDRLLRITG